MAIQGLYWLFSISKTAIDFFWKPVSENRLPFKKKMLQYENVSGARFDNLSSVCISPLMLHNWGNFRVV